MANLLDIFDKPTPQLSKEVLRLKSQDQLPRRNAITEFIFDERISFIPVSSLNLLNLLVTPGLVYRRLYGFTYGDETGIFPAWIKMTVKMFKHGAIVGEWPFEKGSLLANDNSPSLHSIFAYGVGRWIANYGPITNNPLPPPTYSQSITGYTYVDAQKMPNDLEYTPNNPWQDALTDGRLSSAIGWPAYLRPFEITADCDRFSLSINDVQQFTRLSLFLACLSYA